MRASCAVLLAVALTAEAQTFPSRPVRIVVPFQSGGAVDLMARALSDKLADGLGQPVIVDARPGANGSLGTEAVAGAMPDGHTMLLATLSHVTTPMLVKTLWHPTRDFAGVAMMGHVPNVAVVTPELKAMTLRDFVTFVKVNPGKVNFVTNGAGTSQTLSAELLKRTASLDMVGVAYKGLPAAAPDLLSGRVHFSFFPVGAAVPYLELGGLRALAVAAPSRSKLLPNVPTMAEAGYGEVQVISWYAYLVPAATPRPVVLRLNAEFVKVLNDKDVIARIEKIGEAMPAGRPEDVDAMLAAEVARWKGL